MQGRVFQALVIAVFGWAAGHLIWWTHFANDVGDYPVGGDVVTMRPQAKDLDKKNLYARYTFYTAQPADYAWIEAVAYDALEVYVNETRVGITDGLTVNIVANITPQLKIGKNVIAIVTRQTTLSHPPELSVRGGYRLRGQDFTFDSTGEWRYQWYYQRTANYWVANAFDDGNWEFVQRRDKKMVSFQPTPVDALISPTDAKWIGPAALDAETVTIGREFDVPGAVAHAWLRVETLEPYRLSISGQVVDAAEDLLGTTSPTKQPSQWVYDISPFIRAGRNSIAFALSTKLPPPMIRVDAGVVTRSGAVVRVLSDGSWLWQPGSPPGWMTKIASGKPVLVQDGNLGMPVGLTATRAVRESIPPLTQWKLWFHEVEFDVAVGLLTALLVWIVNRVLFPLPANERRAGGLSPGALSLIVPIMIALTAIIIAYDPRISARDVYRPWVVLFVLLAIPVQWVLLAIMRRLHGLRPPSATPAQGPWWQSRGFATLVMLGLLAAGGWLRVKDLAARPLSPDEVSMYRTTMGIYKRGFPSIEIHPDIPPVYASTSELVYLGPAIAALLTDSDRMIIRAPAAAWGTFTIWLLYYCTARLYGRGAGLIAAALYTFSPFCIAMANLGRYYSQLQAFGLLTVYHFYRCIAAEGPLDRRALWWTVVCFMCMMMSWEGSALLAVPMMVAAIVARRDRIWTLLRDPSVYGGMFVITMLIIVQGAHRGFVQTARPFYGSGASDVALTPMWLYPGLDIWYYVRSASWNRDELLAILPLWIAGALMIKHAYRQQMRLLMLIFLGICIFQALVLPVTGKRYSYHLLPMWLMIAGGALMAVLRGMTSLRFRERFALRPYATAVAGVFIVGYIYLAAGLTIDMGDLRTWRTAGTDPDALNLPQQESCAEYVLANMGPDDVVFVNAPHVIDHYLDRANFPIQEYWLQTLMRLQACLDDKRVLPLHRLKGDVGLQDLRELQNVFARNGTIWFIAEPLFNTRTNVPDADRFLRGEMECVYEDFSAMVLKRDASVPKKIQELQEKTLDKAQTNPLP